MLARLAIGGRGSGGATGTAGVRATSGAGVGIVDGVGAEVFVQYGNDERSRVVLERSLRIP